MNHLFHHEMAPVGDWSLAVLILVIWVLLGGLVARIAFAVLTRWASKAHFQFTNMFVRALPVPIYVLVIITGFMVSVKNAPFLDSDVQILFHWLHIALFVAFIYLADNVLQGLIRDLEKRHQGLLESHFLFSAFIHILVWVLGAMFILDGLNISITPILASLGVGSLAVALGFQSTFMNLFSGIYLLLDKPVHMGDYVKLSTGEEGNVEKIGWRTTQIRTPANHMVILPNSKLAENLLQNYTQPDPTCAFSVEVGVDYASDLQQVEALTVEVARGIQQNVPGADKAYAPSVSFHDFGSYSVNFSVNLQALNYGSTFKMKHEFIKALHARYRQEKIVMPFPVQSIEFRNAPPPDLGQRRSS